MNFKKHTARLLLAMVVAFLLIGFASASNRAEESEISINPYKVKVEEETPEFYVNDFAGIFTAKQKDDMIRLAKQLEQDYNGVQVVVTTVRTLGTSTAEEYAYAMYAQYGIGKDDMGVLILIATESRDLKIEPGRNMQTYLTDKLLDNLSEEYAMEYLRADRFADGIIALQTAIINEIPLVVPEDWAADLGITSNIMTLEQATKESKNQGSDWSKIIMIILIIVLVVVVLVNDKSHRKATEKLKKEKELSARKLEELNRSHDEEKKQLLSEEKAKLDSCTQKYETVVAEKRVLETELSTLKSRYVRAKKLHPEIDSEIDNMIISELKDEAGKVDAKLARFERMAASKDHVDEFSSALQLLNSVSNEVKPYLSIDVKSLQKKHSDSVELKRKFEQAQQEKRDREIANDVYNHIRRVVMSTPKANKDNYRELKATYVRYKQLTSSQKSFFEDQVLVEELCFKFKEAEADSKNFDIAISTERDVKSIIDSIYRVDEDDLDSLESAWRRYNALSQAQREYFSDKTYNRLVELLNQARADHSEREERERIHRMNMHNSAMHASGFSSSSTHRSPTSSSSAHRPSSGSSFSRPSSRPSGGGTPPRSSGGLGGRPSGGGVHKKF